MIFDEESLLVRSYDFSYATHLRRYDRQAASHRLEDCHGNSLVQGCVDVDAQTPVKSWHVIRKSNEPHIVLQAQTVDSLLEVYLFWPLPGDNKLDFRFCPANDIGNINEQNVVFYSNQSACGPNYKGRLRFGESV